MEDKVIDHCPWIAQASAIDIKSDGDHMTGSIASFTAAYATQALTATTSQVCGTNFW